MVEGTKTLTNIPGAVKEADGHARAGIGRSVRDQGGEAFRIDTRSPGSRGADGDWIEDTFYSPGRATGVRLRQSRTPGAVVKREVLAPAETRRAVSPRNRVHGFPRRV